MIIYLDESGDLGFDFSKKKTTRKFVITLLLCEEKEATDSLRKYEKSDAEWYDIYKDRITFETEYLR